MISRLFVPVSPSTSPLPSPLFVTPSEDGGGDDGGTDGLPPTDRPTPVGSGEIGFGLQRNPGDPYVSCTENGAPVSSRTTSESESRLSLSSALLSFGIK